MDARYEEKTFESYFNNELDRKTSIYFPLGQVQEGVLGLDSVARSNSRRLWKTLGYPFWFFQKFSGVELTTIAREMEQHLGREVKNIPAMKVNLLLQYKRPQYITNSTGAEWHLWNQKYFRYELYAQQHALLSHIETTFGNDAVVLYAAPSVVDVDDLVTLKIANSIIDNTNFRRARELDGHHRNTYIKAGTYSQACSEPEKIENFNLIEMIEAMQPHQSVDNAQLIINFSSQINTAMENVEGIGYLKTAFENRMNESRHYELQQFELFYSMLTMSVFREVTGCQWLIPLDGQKNA
ncbi:hypothetical protein PRH55_000114 [Morganella morganii]|uniref:hypothetical protein n=1 Tax=Morganella morganii TaxID=582 RepID=UPI00091B3FE3|nr:hypothetical protein [Morganella morganii]SGC39922.1 Uncharacterised protein [Mycobacterium tuberculosis]EKL3976787.1 hypothetical protein [Morganella morganii]ELB1013057.1 hypothetical protein [Morganella morganii]MBA5838294.1 hypothetical protein [Morganella morganii]MBT0413038.1 hypothetical protein [Morganella morganii subsp. morganii]